MDEAMTFPSPMAPTNTGKIFSLAELIDQAEMQNPDTREAWQSARAQAANLGLARSELYPTLAAVVLSQFSRSDVFSGDGFDHQEIQDNEGNLELNYTIVDFGARSGRISAAQAKLIAANFSFNDVHRKIIYEVEHAYYQLLNASGQLIAAGASLTNALAVQHAAEDRLDQGLATLPDVLEARSASAQAEYNLQAAIGAEDIARGFLANALGTSPLILIQVQSLDELKIPGSIPDTVDQGIKRALEQRPDLLQSLAEVDAANAKVKEARSAYFPVLNLNAWGGGQEVYASQDSLPAQHDNDLAGGVGVSLTWSLFDGGARKNRLAKARADVLADKASVNATRNIVAQEVWTAYSNLQTAFHQRQSAAELLASADQSYAAVLESYNQGVRNLLDVTEAERVLAQARSTDVFAQTQVLSALAELAFETGDAIQNTTRRASP
jgi:outer membrane protein